MRRLAVINQKGGVGKTTTTANLGAALARAGRRVLLIDLDPQAHLTLHFGVDLPEGRNNLYDVLVNGISAQQTLIRVDGGVSILPGDIDLAGVEARLINIPGREMILRESIAGLADSFDVALIDCPPALGVLTINALVAATEVVIPLQAHFFALQGLSKLLDTVSLVRQRINPALKVSGVVLCLYESSTRLGTEVVEDLRKFLESSRGSTKPWADARLFEPPIRRNIKLAESSSYGRTVFDYALKSNGAVDYARLAADIFGLDPNEILSGPESATSPIEGRSTDSSAGGSPPPVTAAPVSPDSNEFESHAPAPVALRVSA
jgi:chromosome partitioning protein